MIARGIVPNLVISQRMVDRVTEAARHFLADETGETMVGLVIEPAESSPEAMPTLCVLDTIAPDESVIRRSHMFEQGDELQGDIFVWLSENWEACRDLGKDQQGRAIRPQWQTGLRHLGDWHKQPGFMIQPSGGDLMTALRIMDDEENDFDFLLVPIVTLGHDSVTSEEGASVNYFTIPMDDDSSLRMDWWYIHRDVRIFQPITPHIVPRDELPALTPYPWHILNQERLEEEVALLEDDGLILIGSSNILWEADGDLPLEICFIVARGNGQQVFLVETDWDYPGRPPRVRTAPFTGIDPSMYMFDIFEQLWEHSQPAALPPEFRWQPALHLVDMIAALEVAAGTRSATRNPPARRRVQTAKNISIPVERDEAGPAKKPARKNTAKPVRRETPAQAEDDE